MIPDIQPQLGVGRLTWENEPAERRTVSGSVLLMTLPTRDALVVRLVATYKQATASQIRAVLFADVSLIPLQRVLSRLVKRKYLRRIGRRPAGEKGGSGSFVYELGLAGHFTMTGRRDYKPHTAIDYHALMVLDCYVALKVAENLGVLNLTTEPMVEVAIGHARADMLLRCSVPTQDGERYLALEVEATRKRGSYVLGKCEAYTEAYKIQDGGSYPQVWFIVRHDWQAVELRQVLRNQDRDLFKVVTLSNLVADIIR